MKCTSALIFCKPVRGLAIATLIILVMLPPLPSLAATN